jgi:hypothetical protein
VVDISDNVIINNIQQHIPFSAQVSRIVYRIHFSRHTLSRGQKASTGAVDRNDFCFWILACVIILIHDLAHHYPYALSSKGLSAHATPAMPPGSQSWRRTGLFGLLAKIIEFQGVSSCCLSGPWDLCKVGTEGRKRR